MKYILGLFVLFLMSAKSCKYDPAGLQPKLVDLDRGVAYKYTIIQGKPDIKVSEPETVPLSAINGNFCLTQEETAEIRREWEKFNK